MTEILRPENLSVSYTGERESLETMQKQVRELKKTLHQEAVETSPAPMICEKKNEGFMTSDRYSTRHRQETSARKVLHTQVHSISSKSL